MEKLLKAAPAINLGGNYLVFTKGAMVALGAKVGDYVSITHDREGDRIIVSLSAETCPHSARLTMASGTVNTCKLNSKYIAARLAKILDVVPPFRMEMEAEEGGLVYYFKD